MPTAAFQVPARADAFDAALEGLTRLNVRLLEGAGYPPLYSAGVRYRKEPREVWRHVGHVYTEGWGDCEDLAAWRAAELRLSGEDNAARVATYKSGVRRYHAVVLRGDGSIEDPSKRLGMKGPGTMDPQLLGECAGLADALLGEDEDEDQGGDEGGDEGGDGDPGGQEDPQAEQDPGEDPGPAPQAAVMRDPTPRESRVTTDIKPSRGGYRAVARVPLKTGRALVTASSVFPTQAAARGAALRLASKALNSRVAQALIPPQARMALAVVQNKQARAIARGIARGAGRLFRRRRRK